MSVNPMKIVDWIRIAVYLSGFIAIVWVLATCTEKQPLPIEKTYDVVFFPPDLAPHPHYPWDQPSGPKESEMA